MNGEFLTFLKHIVDSINDIREFSGGLSKDVILKDKLRKSAILRELEVIGEAIKNIPIDFINKYPSLPWADFAGMRDKLIHHYFGVDWDIVWKVVKDELPELDKKIKEILENEKKEQKAKKTNKEKVESEAP